MKIKFLNKQFETIDDLRKEYRKLAMSMHPDKGGNSEDMKILNSEYDYLIKNFNKGSKQFEQEYATNVAYKDILDKLINISDIEIEIVGSWIWISGNTKPHKDLINELNFRWSRNRKMWYMDTTTGNKFEGGKIRGTKQSIDEIKNKYGCKKVKTNGIKCLK